MAKTRNEDSIGVMNCRIEGVAGKDEGGLFPTSLPERDRARWSALTKNQRAKATERLAAFQGWLTGKLTIDEAVAISGLSRSRFYRLAAIWRESPSLEALGAQVGSGASRERLDPRAVNALQAVVAEIVALNDGATVSQLVRYMIEAANLPAGCRLPGVVRLRGIVEDEQRRASAREAAGTHVLFDVSAINLPRTGGRPHIMFAIVDKGTRLILGTSVGDVPDVDEGYRLAASNAQAKIASSLAAAPWADRTLEIGITAGQDRDAVAEMRQRLIDSGVSANIQAKRIPKRYGDYFRKVVGPRIGRIEITPARTEAGLALPDNGDMEPWTTMEAAAAVAAAADEHNSGILMQLVQQGRDRAPDDLKRALHILALQTLTP